MTIRLKDVFGFWNEEVNASNIDQISRKGRGADWSDADQI
jgi:hypothetical protein